MKSFFLAIAFTVGAFFLGYQIGGVVAIQQTVNLINRGVR